MRFGDGYALKTPRCGEMDNDTGFGAEKVEEK